MIPNVGFYMPQTGDLTIASFGVLTVTPVDPAVVVEAVAAETAVEVVDGVVVLTLPGGA